MGLKIAYMLLLGVVGCSTFRESAGQQVLSTLRAKAQGNSWNISVDSLRLVATGYKGNISTYTGYAYLSGGGQMETDTLVVTADMTVTYFEVENPQPLFTKIYGGDP